MYGKGKNTDILKSIENERAPKRLKAGDHNHKERDIKRAKGTKCMMHDSPEL